MATAGPNITENRLSIVDLRVFDIQDGNMTWIGGFQNLEAANGIPLALPITFDGGEARELFVRGAVMVPPVVARAIAQMPEFQNHTLGSLQLPQFNARWQWRTWTSSATKLIRPLSMESSGTVLLNGVHIIEFDDLDALSAPGSELSTSGPQLGQSFLYRGRSGTTGCLAEKSGSCLIGKSPCR